MKQRYRVLCCGDIVEVDTEERCEIKFCKCGNTGIDAEESYVRFVGGEAELLGGFPTIERFIKEMGKTDEYIPIIFTNGGCYRFAKLLQMMYGGELVINEEGNHVGIEVNGKVYDIDGESSEKFREMTMEEIKEAETWGFFKNNLMSMGECDNCGEPLLITKYDKKE